MSSMLARQAATALRSSMAAVATGAAALVPVVLRVVAVLGTVLKVLPPSMLLGST